VKVTSLPTPPVRTGLPKEWTVMLYNAGEQDEGLMCTSNLLDAQTVGSDENTHVVAMNFRSPWIYERFLGIGNEHLGTRSYYVTKEGPDSRQLSALKAWPEMQQFAGFVRSTPERITSPEIPNSAGAESPGEAATLKAFLLENARRFPARHYAVVMSGHGAGFAGQSVVGSSRISNEDVGKVLREVAQELGKPLDLVNLNTCYSAGIEALQPLAGGAHVVVASESTVNAANQNLAPVLQALQGSLRANEEVTPQQLGRLFVEEARHQKLGNLYIPTLSAIQLDKVEAVAEAVAGLHHAVLQARVAPALLRETLAASQQLPYASVPREVNVADLGSFARTLQSRCEHESVKKSCAALSAALSEAILAEQHATPEKETAATRLLRPLLGKPIEDFSGLTGMSIYYDAKVTTPGNRLKQVKDTELGKRLQIEEFLNYLSHTEGSSQPGTLEKLSQQVRKIELKAHKAVGVPYVVPVAKKLLKFGAFMGGCAALRALGVPVTEMLLGPYFAGSGAWAAGKQATEAYQAAAAPGPMNIARREKLVDAACNATMGLTMGTFGLHMMGILPASVVWPVVGVATAARAGKLIGKVLANRDELAEHRRSAAEFGAAKTVAEKLAAAQRAAGVSA
jgi:hypothetical protein